MSKSTSAPSWVTLTPDERVIWKGHPSLWLVGWLVIISLGIIVIGIGAFVLFDTILRLLSIIPVVIGLLIMFRAYLSHKSVYYVLTTQEIYKKSGILSRSVMNIRLDRIQNTSFTQSFLERFMKYGTIEIDTAGTGGTELILYAVSDPRHVNGLITEQLDEFKVQAPDNPA
jgi:uncharacterized membrane protein YdbT with pleckstrin-like domain